jgi:hypothetical protein
MMIAKRLKYVSRKCEVLSKAVLLNQSTSPIVKNVVIMSFAIVKKIFKEEI